LANSDKTLVGGFLDVLTGKNVPDSDEEELE